MAQVEVNTPAPDFCLDDFKGKKVCLADYRGKNSVIIVLNRGLA